MVKNIILFLLSLIVLIPCQSCRFGGSGGGMYHLPPANIKSGEKTIIEIKYELTREGHLKPSDRFSDFFCYYRFSPDPEFKKVPGRSFFENKTELLIKYTIPARELSSGQTLDYYIQYKLDDHENTTEIYTISQ